MIYIREKYAIIMKNELNKFEKLGVLPKAAERNQSFQPFELDVVSTNGGKRNNESDIRPFPPGKGLSILLLERKEDDNEINRQIV